MKKKNKKLKKKSILGKALILIGAVLILMNIHNKSDSWLRNRVVMLSGNDGFCSGEQVRTDKGEDYILSAGHCHELQDKEGNIEVITESGRHIKRKVIAEDQNSDLLLIEGLPNLRGIDIAKSDHRFESIRTFTHGGGMATYETDGHIIQDQHLDIPLFMAEDQDSISRCNMSKEKIESVQIFIFNVQMCMLSVDETITEALIVPGSSGGMIVDRSGDLVGVASASAGSFGSMVRLQDIRKFLANY